MLPLTKLPLPPSLTPLLRTLSPFPPLLGSPPGSSPLPSESLLKAKGALASVPPPPSLLVTLAMVFASLSLGRSPPALPPPPTLPSPQGPPAVSCLLLSRASFSSPRLMALSPVVTSLLVSASGGAPSHAHFAAWPIALPHPVPLRRLPLLLPLAVLGVDPTPPWMMTTFSSTARLPPSSPSVHLTPPFHSLTPSAPFSLLPPLSSGMSSHRPFPAGQLSPPTYPLPTPPLFAPGLLIAAASSVSMMLLLPLLLLPPPPLLRRSLKSPSLPASPLLVSGLLGPPTAPRPSPSGNM